MTQCSETPGRTTALAFAMLLVAAAACPGALVSEQWGGQGAPCTHPGALTVARGSAGCVLSFELSALPAGAAVHHASLHCFTKRGAQPRTPARLHAVRPDGQRGAALTLEAPWYRSFDATAAVRQWAGDRAGRLRLAVASFDGLLPERTRLEVRFEGTPRGAPEHVTHLRAVHHDGQTFLVWRELKAFRPPAGSVVWVEKFARRGNVVAKGPGAGWRGRPRVPAITLKTLRGLQGLELRDKASGFQGIRQARRVRRVPDVRYRVYRHKRRITPATIRDAELLGEARPLSAYDQKMAVIAFKGEYIDQREVGGSIIPTSCVADGEPVAAGEALYVHTPREAGRWHYAVTAVRDGTENVSDLSAACSLAEPVAETPAPPVPVLQRLQEIGPRSNVLERWYLFWPTPPQANLPGDPLHVLVGEPAGAKGPLPMVIDGFHGGFNLVGALRVPSRTALTLLIEHQVPWGGDGDLLYSAGRGTLRSYQQCPCDYFSERCFLRLIDWAMAAWPIDRARVFGGQHDSGPLHLGVRHPEIFRRIFLGNYTASYVYPWSPPGQGLAGLLGPKELARTTDGHNAWDVLDLAWFLRQDPGRDVPLVLCSSGTGKDSGHTSEFGWQDDPRAWAAFLAARQPFIAAWSTGGDDPGGHQQVRAVQPEVARMFTRLRWDASLPAFSNCSLDNNPGNGDPADGDSCGQINGYLIWDNTECVDTEDAWEMTVWLVATSPEPSCTVDVTPRRCRRFRAKEGERFAWTSRLLAGGGPSRGGAVTADRWGLVTLRGLTVTKGKCRLVIRRAGQARARPGGKP